MKHDNYYDFSIFERVCMILFYLLNIILFIYAFQNIFTSGNIVISIICLLICIVDVGYFLASRKMNEKHGRLMEIKNLHNVNNYNLSNKDLIVNEYIKRSNLPKEVCSIIYDILNCFNNNEKPKATDLILDELIPVLKTNVSCGQVGIAFGMLISEKGLTQEQANELSRTLINEMVNNKEG